MLASMSPSARMRRASWGQDGQQIGKSRRFRNTRPGVRALLEDVQRLPEPAKIGLEATGHYYEAPRSVREAMAS